MITKIQKGLDIVYAIYWAIMLKLKLMTWKDLKSLKYRNRQAKESEHRSLRIVDDVYAIKFNNFFSRLLISSFERQVYSDLEDDRIIKEKGGKFSIIIAFGDQDGSRVKLLKPCIERTTMLFPESEVIISCSYENYLKLKQIKVICERVIFSLHENGINEFNIAMAVNAGVRRSSRANLCILQADIFLPMNFGKIFNLFHNCDCDYMFPSIGVMFMDRDSTEYLINSNIFKPRLGSFCRELESYVVLIKRDAFYEIGGYYPGFSESGEDNDFYDRLCVLNPVEDRMTAVYHLWHPPFWKSKFGTVARNKSTLNELRKRSIKERILLAREAMEAHFN